MDNIELEQKVLEIINEVNYFDMIIKVKEFEPEYKKSDFYKNTKKPLSEVIKETKIFYALQLRNLGDYIQNIIDNLSLEQVNNILDKMGNTFAKENEEIQDGLEVFKNFKN